MAAKGSLPELAGLAAVLTVMKVTGSDLAAALSGVVMVALLRLFA